MKGRGEGDTTVLVILIMKFKAKKRRKKRRLPSVFSPYCFTIFSFHRTHLQHVLFSE